LFQIHFGCKNNKNNKMTSTDVVLAAAAAAATSATNDDDDCSIVIDQEMKENLPTNNKTKAAESELVKLKSEKLHLTNGSGGNGNGNGNGDPQHSDESDDKQTPPDPTEEERAAAVALAAGEEEMMTTTLDNNNNTSVVNCVNNTGSGKTNAKDLKLMLKQLQADLRAEECKLLLLKRLHYSQKNPAAVAANQQAAGAAAINARTNQLNGQLSKQNQAQNNQSQKVRSEKFEIESYYFINS
jgi:hypothetical protein